jgi:hypothetical protein
MAETWDPKLSSRLHLCTGHRPVALLHLGQHVVLSLPAALSSDNPRLINIMDADQTEAAVRGRVGHG